MEELDETKAELEDADCDAELAEDAEEADEEALRLDEDEVVVEDVVDDVVGMIDEREAEGVGVAEAEDEDGGEMAVEREEEDISLSARSPDERCGLGLVVNALKRCRVHEGRWSKTATARPRKNG